jgi:hypothetical protein
MAKREELVIEIDATGKISGDVAAGPGGKGCLDMLEEVLGGIGGKAAESHKPEIYQQVLPARGGVAVKR